MKDEKVSLVFAELRLKLAEHNLDVAIKRALEDFFRSAKENALVSEEKAKVLDRSIRDLYDDDPRRLAEWEQVMQRYEFSDDVIEL